MLFLSYPDASLCNASLQEKKSLKRIHWGIAQIIFTSPSQFGHASPFFADVQNNVFRVLQNQVDDGNYMAIMMMMKMKVTKNIQIM